MPAASSSLKVSSEDFDIFREYLHKHSGIVLGGNKQYLMTSRLSGLMQEKGIETVKDLVSRIERTHEKDLRNEVLDAMTTNETNWFRDAHPYEVLSEMVFTAFAHKKKLRIWSAACSSGQEAYTISMVFSEFVTKNPDMFPFGLEIIGTDLSASMLERAQAAEYSELEMSRGLSDARKRQFFESVPDSSYMRVKQKERSRVSFRYLNLLSNYDLLGKFDVIFCRNVLIYFSPEGKMDVLNRLEHSLQSDGYLFIGASEAMPRECKMYQMVNCNPGLVYKKR